VTTSATATFNLDLNAIVEEAFERCGAELRSGYDLRTARRSLNLMLLEWANRGVNLWTIEQGSQVLTPGTATYNLPVDTVDLLEHVIRTGTGQNQTDIDITRISVSTFASIPNKTAQGRPIQVWIDRKSGQTSAASVVQYPTFTVWPVPDSSQTYTFVYWRLRRMLDAGTGVTNQDIPFRFLPCLVAGLAYFMSVKIAPDRMVALKAMYDESWELAAGEDREKAAVRFVPRQQFLTG
jgi:hypothetical protein